MEADTSVLVPYKGQPLASGMQAFWRVQVWDQAGAESAWSATAQWTMGLLKSDDWKGKWIGQDDTTPFQHPGSPFQLLKTAHWIWFEDSDAARNAPASARWFKAAVTIPAAVRFAMPLLFWAPMTVSN